ncbi:MAG: hypothetical protein QM813_19240 [Verrucomicrobiota bacterium]
MKAMWVVVLAALPELLQAAAVPVEAETGTPGADWAVSNSVTPAYVASTTTGAGGNPGSAARVISYNVTFPTAGTYNLYVRLQVGGGGFNDDSLFYGNGFGAKSATTDNDWQLINGLASGGSTATNEVVAGIGAAGTQIWKWVNLSEFSPSGSGSEPAITFTVPVGNLTQTFQIGAREDGLLLDKFVFGSVSNTFTVFDLDNNTGGTPPPTAALTNTFVGPDGNTLHRFNPLSNGLNLDGANPTTGLAWSGSLLFGTTLNGGAQGLGTAFYLNADGSNFVAFRSFAVAPDANNPSGEFFLSGNQFFGTSLSGGNNGAGTVFAIQTNGNISVLRHFFVVAADTATNSGGASPAAALTLAGGTLYGIATAGGANGNGTIFALTTNGVTFSVLHDFSLLDAHAGANAAGATPWGGLLLRGDRLYGTASAGGGGGNGVIFSIRTNGADFTALYNFTPTAPLTGTNIDGAIPYGGLVETNGTLYGTTFAGGAGGCGPFFRSRPTASVLPCDIISAPRI